MHCSAVLGTSTLLWGITTVISRPCRHPRMHPCPHETLTPVPSSQLLAALLRLYGLTAPGASHKGKQAVLSLCSAFSLHVPRGVRGVAGVRGL